MLGNNDDRNGPANEGCLCIERVTSRSCGVCADGQQTCTNGRTGQYGGGTGGTQMRTYYRDADGDGYGSSEAVTVCGAAPDGYVAGPTGDWRARARRTAPASVRASSSAAAEGTCAGFGVGRSSVTAAFGSSAHGDEGDLYCAGEVGTLIQ